MTLLNTGLALLLVVLQIIETIQKIKANRHELK